VFSKREVVVEQFCASFVEGSQLRIGLYRVQAQRLVALFAVRAWGRDRVVGADAGAVQASDLVAVSAKRQCTSLHDLRFTSGLLGTQALIDLNHRGQKAFAEA